VLARPIAGVERGRYALVLSAGARLPEYPLDDSERRSARTKRARKAPADGR
jgi:hypothetical protein